MAVLCSLQGLWATAVLSPPGCFCTSTSVCTPVNTGPFHSYFPHQKWIISDVNFCSVPPCQHLKGHCPTPKAELLHECCPAMHLKELSQTTVSLLEQMRNRKPQLQVWIGLDFLPDTVLQPWSFTELQGTVMGVPRANWRMPSAADFHSLIQMLCIPSCFHSPPPSGSFSFFWTQLQKPYMRLKHNLD